MNATTRASVLTVALGAAIVLPIATTFVAATYSAAPHLASGTQIATPPVHASTARIRPIQGPIVTPPAPEHISQAPRFALQRLHIAIPRFVVIAAVALWALAAIVALIRLTISLLHLERLKHDALPLAIEYRTRMDRWTRAAKGGRGVRLCRSPEVSIPIAVGLFDAMILVPETLIDELSPEDVDRILLHELAHLRRGDDWVNAFERIGQALFFFNPGILWIVGRLDLEREVVCDDWVLDQTAEIRQYATCLARVAEITAWPYRAMAAPGAFITRRSMSIRIERLLEAGRDVRIHTSIGPAGLATATLAALCIVAAFVSPSFAYSVTPAATKSPHNTASAGSTHGTRNLPAAWHAATALQRPIQAKSVKSAAEKAEAETQNATPEPATPAPAVTMRAMPKPDEPKLKSVEMQKVTVAYTRPQTPRASTPISTVSQSTISSQTIAAASSGDYIDDLAAAGYHNLSLDDLIRLKSLGVTGAYIRDLEAAGLPHPSVDDLTRLAAVGVNGDYVREMRRMFPNVSSDDLSSLKAVGVNGEYVDELRSDGFTNMSVDDVRSMRAVGVDPQYIRQMRGLFGNLSAEQMRSMRAVGVTPDYVQQLHNIGFRSLGPDEVTKLHAIGVDPAYVRELRDAGYPNLSEDDIERCRALGIDAAFIRNAASHGFRNLTIEQLVRLKASGIL